MKRLLTLASLCMFIVNCMAQTIYGFNGTNVPENLTPEVRTKIVQMHPEGDTVCMVFRNDKYTGAAPISELQNVISLATELEQSGKHFAMVYTFNTRADSLGNPSVDIDDNFFAFNYFLDAGIDIIAGRLGNEEYFKAAGHGGNWSAYWSVASPVRDWLLTYDIDRVIIPVADYQDTKWNNSAAALINSSPVYEPDYHFYWGKNELPIYSTLITNAKGELVLPAELSNGTYLPNTDNFYQSVYTELTTSDALAATMAWHAATFPGKKMWVTEYGPPGNPGGLGGAVGFEATTDWFLNETKQYSDIRVLCKFNGPSVTGIITKKGKLDADFLGTYVDRLSYLTLRQFYYNKGASFVQLIIAPGTYTFSYHNLTRATVDLEGMIEIAQGLQIDDMSYTGITGDNFYSSSGQMQWWANGSTKTYEISGAGTWNYIPSLSYGYITVIVSAAPVYGCTDKEATNYNPEATVDDGSCVYPQPECYRKRWLFTSLPCKVATRNCNCSPTKL